MGLQELKLHENKSVELKKTSSFHFAGAQRKRWCGHLEWILFIIIIIITLFNIIIIIVIIMQIIKFFKK